MKPYLTAREIAKLEFVDQSTIVRWIHKGFFPNARKIGRVLRIPVEDYAKWRESTKINVRTTDRTNQ